MHGTRSWRDLTEISIDVLTLSSAKKWRKRLSSKSGTRQIIPDIIGEVHTSTVGIDSQLKSMTASNAIGIVQGNTNTKQHRQAQQLLSSSVPYRYRSNKFIAFNMRIDQFQNVFFSKTNMKIFVENDQFVLLS